MSLQESALNYLNRKKQQVTQFFQQPVQSNPLTQGIVNVAQRSANILNNPKQLFLPTSQQFQQIGTPYIKQQVVQPIQQGISTTFGRNQTPLNRVMGAGQILQGAFNATPGGVGFNALTAGETATAINAKGQQPFLSSFVNSFRKPTSFATEGLGITNPVAALAVDVLAGNPKSAFKHIPNLKTAKFKMNPMDVEELIKAQDILVNPKKFEAELTAGARNPQEYGQMLEKGIQDAEQLIRDLGQRHMPTKKLASVGDDPIKIATELYKLHQKNKLGLFNTTPSNQYLVDQTRGPQTLNTSKLKVSPEQQAHIGSLEDITPREVLKNKDVLKEADFANAGKNPVTMEATQKKLAGQLASRQKVVSLEKEFSDLKSQNATPEVLQKKIEEIAKASKVARTEGTEAGRQLQARNILADAQATPMQKVFRLLDNAGVDEKTYSKEAANVDFNNANEVVNFYRKYVPPTAGEWIDVVRYNSMLSSPLTHISNIASNTINSAVIAPIEKTVTGAVDFIGSKLRGKEQTQFAGEGVEYAKGYYSKLGEATQRFRDVIAGKNSIKNLDLDYMPVGTSGKLGKKLAHLQYPTRLLEGMDQFFMALTEGGERKALQYRQGKGISVPEIETTATNNASYRLFRSQTHDKRQGHILNSIDDVTDKISQLRNSDNPVTSNIAKFTLPFVRTPMNILKQGIEYGPQGILTLPGAKNKSEQISKILIGSSAMMATEMMFQSGRTTWAEPTDAKKKQAFRDAGLQPYSVKIGDQWVSYQKLPPALSFPMAIVSALHDAQENKTIDQNGLDVVLNTIAKSGKFFSDQSYLKNIGDIIGLAGKDPERVASFVGNYPQQLVPWRALMSWATRLTDPYQRKVNTDAGYLEQQTQQLLLNIPILSQKVPTRNNEFGEPITNQNRVINSFSPLKVNTENPDKKEYYDLLKEESKINKNLTVAGKMLEQGKEVPPGIFDVGAAGEKNPAIQRLLEEKKLALIKKKIKFGKDVSNEDLDKVYLADFSVLSDEEKGKKRASLIKKVNTDKSLTDDEKKHLLDKIGPIEVKETKKKTGGRKGTGKKGSKQVASLLKEFTTKVSKARTIKLPKAKGLKYKRQRIKAKGLKEFKARTKGSSLKKSPTTYNQI